MTIEPVTRLVYRAPTSGKMRCTKAAAYREEARARFLATCDCEADHWPPCRYHDVHRWERDELGYSVNGRVIARWAAILARRDGVAIDHPPAPVRAGQEDEQLPF